MSEPEELLKKEQQLIEIVPATLEDAEAILSLQKIAYQSEAEIYNDYEIPPLLQTLDSVQDDFQNFTFLKALSQGKLVGSIKLSQKDDTCFIERLIVEPECQNRGIGSRLLRAAEEYFPSARYELFTGDQSKKNIYLYQKRGYSIFQSKKLSEKVTLVFMEKKNNK